MSPEIVPVTGNDPATSHDQNAYTDSKPEPEEAHNEEPNKSQEVPKKETDDPRLLAARLEEIEAIYEKLAYSACNSSSVFGEEFQELSPDPDAGYAKAYLNRYMQMRDSENRGFLRLDRYHDSDFVDPFKDYYSGDWLNDKLRRVSGITFGGYKIDPLTLQKSCGLWSRIFRPDPNNTNRLQFTGEDPTLDDDTFNLESHIYNGSQNANLFLSTTRSVSTAQHFALYPGSVGNFSSVGFVYIFLVRNAFDLQDLSLMKEEQELTVSAVIPWQDIIGYRKMMLYPDGNKNAPPELVGPIFLRKGFSEQEPRLAEYIVRQMSVKSKYTLHFEKGEPWRDKPEEPDKETSYERRYREKFPWNSNVEDIVFEPSSASL